jgi:hypothetical protein
VQFADAQKLLSLLHGSSPWLLRPHYFTVGMRESSACMHGKYRWMIMAYSHA